MDNLTEKHCLACEAGVPPLSNERVNELLQQINDWSVSEKGDCISRRFEFKGFYKTMAFVNAIAWIANQEGHHPDLHVGYNYCVVDYTTHAIAGLTDNDFICAAKIERLLITEAA